MTGVLVVLVIMVVHLYKGKKPWYERAGIQITKAHIIVSEFRSIMADFLRAITNSMLFCNWLYLGDCLPGLTFLDPEVVETIYELVWQPPLSRRLSRSEKKLHVDEPAVWIPVFSSPERRSGSWVQVKISQT
ncbi:hypothetical protein F5Y15DRAFT_46930 [Xylariaceae sp. FL0016]|nr:hypothetical protein F5Y15DRAFT_46930 [Xylariaceae sp. FL0016]